MELGEGSDIRFSLSNFTIGNRDSDNYITTCYDYEFKPQFALATDASGNQYVDGNGNPWIFN